MLITTVIDAIEERYIVIVDITWTFFNASMKDYILMTLQGTLVELMVRVAPKIYLKYVQLYKSRKPFLYIRVLYCSTKSL